MPLRKELYLRNPLTTLLAELLLHNSIYLQLEFHFHEPDVEGVLLVLKHKDRVRQVLVAAVFAWTAEIGILSKTVTSVDGLS